MLKRRRIFVLAAVMLVCFSALAQVTQNAKAAPPPEARVDINHATMEELLKVPGMTPSWAGRIVRFRPYRAKNDLIDRGVVTGEVYAHIKDYIVAHHERE